MIDGLSTKKKFLSLVVKVYINFMLCFGICENRIFFNNIFVKCLLGRLYFWKQRFICNAKNPRRDVSSHLLRKFRDGWIYMDHLYLSKNVYLSFLNPKHLIWLEFVNSSSTTNSRQH